MDKDAQIAFRLPQERVEQLKAYAAQLTQEFGAPVSVAAALRRIVDSHFAEQPGQPKRASGGASADGAAKTRI